MKLRALALAASLAMMSSAYAVPLDLVDEHYLGDFGPGEIYIDIFSVATAGTIDHTLTFDITTDLNAGSGILDISLGNIININGLTAEIFDSNNTHYASFVAQVGNPDLLVLPLGSYFGVDSYTLKIGGTATGALGGAYTIAAVTAPVPEPETWAMLLAGMGLVGLRALQKAKASSQPPLN
jgi:hypothetical protein